jgi:hypothetical protein
MSNPRLENQASRALHLAQLIDGIWKGEMKLWEKSVTPLLGVSLNQAIMISGSINQCLNPVFPDEFQVDE